MTDAASVKAANNPQKVEPRNELCDFATIVKEAVNALDEMITSKSLKIRFDLPQGGCEIFGTCDHLRYLVRNLVVNAIQVTPNGKAVCVTVDRKRDRVRLAVRDEGPGIQESWIPHLFKVYYRGKTAKNSGVPGDEPGLPTAKAIVESHNGKIHVRNLASGGAEFLVVLPSNPHSGTQRLPD
jgi:signal transduction histidine kinase